MPVGPDELNVFCLPHIKVKSIVTEIDNKLETALSDDNAVFRSLLDDLTTQFSQLKKHEEIENNFIMAPLQPRLSTDHKVSLENDIHGDDRLEGLMESVERMRRRGMWSVGERMEFLVGLREEIRNFIHDLLPHMEEEEQVYQPLLLEHFSRDELHDIREVVLEMHNIRAETDEKEGAQRHPKPAQKDPSPSPSLKQRSSTKSRSPSLTSLPQEVLVKILGHLSPRDLCSIAQVNHTLAKASSDGLLWQHLHPIRWFHGHWKFFKPPKSDKGDCSDGFDDSMLCARAGSPVSDGWSAQYRADEEDEGKAALVNQLEEFLSGFVEHVLPRVGKSVQTLSLAYGGEVDSDLIGEMLSLCPNLKYLDLSYTTITDSTFRGLWRSSSKLYELKTLNLCGCVRLTDTTMQRLGQALTTSPSHRHISLCWSDAEEEESSDECGAGTVCYWSTDYSESDIECCCLALRKKTHKRSTRQQRCSAPFAAPHLKHLNLSGCHLVTDVGLRALTHKGLPSLVHLDVSGLYLATASALSEVATKCPQLQAEQLSYCDNIMDGPYSETANGCGNLESGLPCCRNSVPLY